MGICMTMSYAHLSLLTASSVRREELGLFCFLSERRWFSPKERKESEVTQLCPTLCDPMDCSLPGSPSMGFSRQGYGSGLLFLLQGIFLTQGLNLGLSHCQ